MDLEKSDRKIYVHF